MMTNTKKNTLKGSDIFLKILEDEGIEFLFGNPGTTELPIMNSLSTSKIKYVLALQESIVVAMADGYSRSTKKLSVCNIHVAPGLGNAMGALYNAKFTNSPILVTAGQQERGHGLTEPMLYAPLLPIAEPLVKWAYELERVEDIPRTINRAIKIAKTPPTGPVFISLPGDIMNDNANQTIDKNTNIYTNIISDDSTINKICEKIFKSTNPAIIVGDEISTTDALLETSNFSKTIGAPVYQQTVPWGAHFLSEYPTFIKALSRIQKEVYDILSQYDLLIVLGADPLRMSVYREDSPIPENMPIIHIGLNSSEIGKNYPTEIGVIANLKFLIPILTNSIISNKSINFTKQVNKRLKKIKTINWKNNKEKYLKEISKTYKNYTKITADIFVSELSSILPENVVLVDEGLTTTANLLNVFPFKDSNSYHGLASGGIGWAIAGAIGVQLAQPTRPVVAVIGDGSAMYGIQALWTAANLKLPITYIIVNNHSYNILKERLNSFHGNQNYIGMDLQNPSLDFTKIGANFGLMTFKVTERKKLKQVIFHAIQLEKPTLVEVEIN